jgi:hypothetical protein
MTVPTGTDRLPGTAILISPIGLDTATVRQRIRQGVHNGAHLDHLAALVDGERRAGGSEGGHESGRLNRPWRPWRPWRPKEIEFGAGLMVAESYAMSVELLAVAECLLAGRLAEARELRAGLVSRMGRLPGYRDWRARRPATSAAAAEACGDHVVEFATLPTLAARYVTGPLDLIARGWRDPLIPPALAERIRTRWTALCERSAPAARLTWRAADFCEPEDGVTPAVRPAPEDAPGAVPRARTAATRCEYASADRGRAPLAEPTTRP